MASDRWNVSFTDPSATSRIIMFGLRNLIIPGNTS